MKMRKIMALGLAIAMMVAMVGCGSTSAEVTTGAEAEAQLQEMEEETATEAAEVAEADVPEITGSYTVGICQLVQHPALDAATQGFEDALKAQLGDAVTFDYQDASGESANCATIVNGFVASNVDLIMTNATAPLQAAASATADIPILGTSVTDYATALEIADWTGVVGGNISGTSDLAPLDQQAAMLNELFPDAKKVGLLYCSAEPNSVYQCTEMEKFLKDYGYEVEWCAFTDTNDVASVTQAAADSCDVLYIPTDNTAAANTEAIANIVIPAKVPVIAGEEGICSGCGVATLSISYYYLGYATGLMATKVLYAGEDISQMPVEYAPNVTKEYNAANCEALGITVPDDYTAIAE